MVGNRDEDGVQMFGVFVGIGRLQSEVSEGKGREKGMKDRIIDIETMAKKPSGGFVLNTVFSMLVLKR